MKLVGAFEKLPCNKCRVEHRRPVNAACKAQQPPAKLVELLRHHSFEDALRRGLILDIQGATRKTGMTPQHLRRLCNAGTLEHLERAVGSAVQYYFFPEQLEAVFRLVKAAA